MNLQNGILPALLSSWQNSGWKYPYWSIFWDNTLSCKGSYRDGLQCHFHLVCRCFLLIVELHLQEELPTYEANETEKSGTPAPPEPPIEQMVWSYRVVSEGMHYLYENRCSVVPFHSSLSYSLKLFKLRWLTSVINTSTGEQDCSHGLVNIQVELGQRASSWAWNVSQRRV